jgi:hypothetical protein
MLQEIKGVLFWAAVVLALFLYAQHGCRSRMDQFRERWQEQREDRQERRQEDGFFRRFWKTENDATSPSE